MKKVLLTLTTVLSCSAAMAQWTSDPSVNTKVSPDGQEIYAQEFAVNKDGLVFFNYNAPHNNNTETFLQILDKEGNKMLDGMGLTVSDKPARGWVAVNQMLMSDKDGNAIIAVSDCRNAPAGSQDLSYTIYKVSPEGEMLWGEDGVDLEKGESVSSEAKMSMIQLEDGSYIFAWARSKSADDLYKIYMERLSADGEFLWENPIVIESADNNCMYTWLANAGDNQFVMMYAKGINQVLTAQKYDFDGTPVWPQEASIYDYGFGSIPIWTFVEMIPDTKGGIFVGWYDDRYSTNYSKTYVSHVTNEGKLGFISGKEGTALANPEYMRGFAPKMVYDEKTDCLFTLHCETDADQNWYHLLLQKVSMDGELLWGSEGYEVMPLENNCTMSYYSLQNAGEGNFTVFYQKLEGNASNSNVLTYAIRFDGNGDQPEEVWENPVQLSTMNCNKSGLESSPLMNNEYYITMWSNNYTNEGTFMQRINLDGTLGMKISVEEETADKGLSLTIGSNGNEAVISVTNDKAAEATIDIYNAAGALAANAFGGRLDAGTTQVTAGGLTAGMYIAVCKTADRCASVKFVIE